MTPERWQQVDQILEKALEREPAQRRTFLDETCAGDEELRREVESLLAYESKGQHFLERPPLEMMADSMADESPSLIGQHVGPYQILSLLGAGGMGEVYKARDTRLNRTVAIKVLPRHLSERGDLRRRFLQEAKAASALNHSNIITLHDIMRDDGRDFLVMEYVPGKTLDKLIPSRGMRPKEALKLAIQIADALTNAHAAGIVHRDLKPSNVMVTDEGLVKVLDFGLAKLTEVSVSSEGTTTTVPETEERGIFGTPSYMSPEQAEGKKIDSRSDIFSFGSVLYEMTSGRRAFRGDSKMSTLAAIIHREPEPLSGRIPRDVEKVISRCLRKEIQRRYQHMDDVKIALEELKEESDSRVLGTEAQGVATRGKLRWAGVLVVIAVAVTALGIAVWLWLKRSDRTPEQAQLTTVPLTTYRGYESIPSFSPDETQVAFSWCKKDEGCHIYIKQVGVEPPFQLTNTRLPDSSPAWSPDGRLIAFIRASKQNAVMLIPQRGGSERQLSNWDLSKLEIPPDPPYVAWTPDSQRVAFPYAEEDEKKSALLLMSVNTGEKRWLTTAPGESAGDSSPAFSPDGRTLAFVRQMGDASDLYLLRLRAGYWPQAEPERVITGNPVNRCPVWMPNGRELVIETGTLTSTKICRISVSNPGKPVSLGLTSENAWGHSISRTGKRLAYGVTKFDLNIWRVDLGRPGGTPNVPVELISSTKYEGQPQYSADGKKIVFTSARTGAMEVWTCDGEGRNQVQLTSFGFEAVQGPRWSPDGQNIVFSGTVGNSQQVYVVSAGGGAPRRLTNQPGANQWPFWSHDGRWIYFKNSPAHGTANAWKVPPQGGEETQVTHCKEAIDTPQESPDGKFLYFARGWPLTLSIWRVPIEGGEETEVLDSVFSESRWTARQEGIYYVADPSRGALDLCLLDFVSGKTRKLFRASWKMTRDIAISPDAQTVLYSQADEASSDLMLVENFR